MRQTDHIQVFNYLKDAGFDPRQAEAISRALEMTSERTTETFQVTLNARLDAIAAKIETSFHKEIHAQTWRILGLMLAVAGLTITLLKLWPTH